MSPLQPVTCTHCGNVVAYVPGPEKKHVIIGECRLCHFTHKEKHDGARSSRDPQGNGSKPRSVHDGTGSGSHDRSAGPDRVAAASADTHFGGMRIINEATYGTHPEFHELCQTMDWDAAMIEWKKRYPTIEDVPDPDTVRVQQ